MEVIYPRHIISFLFRIRGRLTYPRFATTTTPPLWKRTNAYEYASRPLVFTKWFIVWWLSHCEYIFLFHKNNQKYLYFTVGLIILWAIYIICFLLISNKMTRLSWQDNSATIIHWITILSNNPLSYPYFCENFSHTIDFFNKAMLTYNFDDDSKKWDMLYNHYVSFPVSYTHLTLPTILRV